ncbi:MAG: tetratricopeptide repeat protein [Phycisphaerales bacterium]
MNRCLRQVVQATLGIAALCSGVVAVDAQQETPLVPLSFELAEPARKAINATWLTDEERSALRVFHGVWIDADLDSPGLQAVVALNAWDFAHPSLNDPATPIELRAEALQRAGQLHEAVDLLQGVDSFSASRIRAESLELLGDFAEADRAVDAPVEQLLARKLDDAVALTEGVRALVVRSRLRGQPARDYQTMLDLLGQARSTFNRLYWPAILTEADLLVSKDNAIEAIDALHEVLSLNPRCADAWFRLGLVALGRFDFDSARGAGRALKRLNPYHPLAHLLEAEIGLIQGDPAYSLEQIEHVLTRMPQQRDALQIQAAALALQYNDDALQKALDAYDTLSPGSALAYNKVGTILSFDRQYEQAAEMLNEAIARQPRWPTPQVELGLLELQSGRDALALDALQRVASLDPFNKRAANSLFLLQELMQHFKQVETEFFIIRYSPESGDQVLVDQMVRKLDDIHRTVADRFSHEPARKTIIELMPDHKWFGVRISGMPFIHTIAACTGPVIAMEAPREGPRQLHLGTFDWPRVLQHEYTHTITLSQTSNRIPHWLTEAAAVSMEHAPRDHDRVMALVNAWREKRLFDLEEINWAFVRPKRPGDRSLAYNQGFWMVQFMNETFGESALIRLLERYDMGDREEDALPQTLGVSREEFYTRFLAWADEQISAWGYNPTPSRTDLEDEIRSADPELSALQQKQNAAYLKAMANILVSRIGSPVKPDEQILDASNWPAQPRVPVEITDEHVTQWLELYPDNPDVLEIAIGRTLAMAGQPTFEHVPLLERYLEARPADPSPHRPLALIWQQSSNPERAIPHLEELDIRSEYDEVYAVALAKLYRDTGDSGRALQKITRAVNINAYHAPHRELAAAIAIEAGRLDLAREHIIALTILEPDRAQHEKRLEAIDKALERAGN